MAWKPATFDHSGQSDCASCHTTDKPANHFAGQCSTCHNSNCLAARQFQSQRLTDCVSCHTKNKPTNHFAGQCSTCHATGAWVPATFNHNWPDGLCVLPYQGQADQSLFRPVQHVSQHGWLDSGQLQSQRPNRLRVLPHQRQAQPITLRGSVARVTARVVGRRPTFNHTGQTDCASCHTKDKPNNHFAGQCSTCHNTTVGLAPVSITQADRLRVVPLRPISLPITLRGSAAPVIARAAGRRANFNHTGQTDCASCHTRISPINHFAGQCSTCHNTNWGDANFNHTGAIARRATAVT